LTLAPLSTSGPLLELGGSIFLDHLSTSSEFDAVLFQSVDPGLSSVYAALPSANGDLSSSLEDVLRSCISNLVLGSLPRLVPSCNSDPTSHLNCCFFELGEHLLICPTDPIGIWDSVDQLLHVLDSPIQPKRPEHVFINLVSSEIFDSVELPSSSN
jgi:hypothetical protein